MSTHATEKDPPSTRDRILIAAATMLGEDPAASLSVRAVSARAGVSTGSLRHFFPTQQALIDTVVAGIYAVLPSTDLIHDTSVSAEDRLLGCLQQTLQLFGAGEAARRQWRTTLHAYLDVDPGPDARKTYVALEAGGRRRIQGWLEVLTSEGALAPGDDEGRARFLSTVLDGMSIQRGLPVGASHLAAEEASLRRAVRAVLDDDHQPESR